MAMPERVKNEVTNEWHNAPNAGPTTHDRVVARMSSLREAIASAEELRLEPDQSDMPARLQALRDALPPEILSSAEKCRRVARRMPLITWSAGSFVGTDFCLIFAP